MDQNNQSQKEADKAFKKGKEALTTGLFQWKKDYNMGAMCFEDAAKLYKQSKNVAKEKESWSQALLCNEQLNDPWAVGRNYEALITCIIESPQIDFAELTALTRKAVMYFKASDSGMKAITLYVKVIKFLIEKEQFKIAEELLNETLQECEDQQAPSTKSDILSLYTEILCQTQRYSKVAELYQQEIQKGKAEPMKYPLNQYALIILIMYILQDEIMRANDETQNLIINVENFHKSLEFKAIDQMLNAFEKGDQKLFDEAALKSCVTSLYPPIVFIYYLNFFFINYPKKIVRLLRKVKVRVIQMSKQPQDEDQRKKDLEKMIL